MPKHARQNGSSLILLMVIVATLAILAAMLVMVLANEQHATAAQRERKAAGDYAEAALDDAVTLAKTKTMSTTGEWLPDADLLASLSSAALPAGAAVTYRVYDNQSPVNYSIKWDQGSPTSPTTPDGMVWVEATVSYLGKTSRMRVLVRQTEQSIVSGLPRAVLYSDTGIALNGTSDIYALDPSGQPHTGGPPYPTTVMAGGNITGNLSANLAAPGTTAQSIGGQYNGSLSGFSFIPNNFVHGGVGLLSDYFDQGEQADLGDEARAACTLSQFQTLPTSPVYTSKAALLSACSYNAATKTYTASTDLVWRPPNRSSLTLTLNDAGTTYNFKGLYIEAYDSSHPGNLTLSGTTTTNTTALYVSGDFTINGPGSTNRFGPLYVAGTASWKGPSSGRLGVQTTTLTDPTPQPMYAKILMVDGSSAGYDGSSGPYDLVLGDTWLDGDAGTSNVACNFSGPSGTRSTVMCPLLATTEKTVTNGWVDFGTSTQPMTYYMQCDNDGLYSNTCQWGSSGTFYGLMVIMEAVIQITGGNETQPSVEGAIFCGTPYVSGTTPSTNDITLSGASSVAYNQAVIDRCVNTSITTTTTTTNAVPGTWQQLSPQ
jgi:type II secretory pathway pseudopilin PulG